MKKTNKKSNNPVNLESSAPNKARPFSITRARALRRLGKRKGLLSGAVRSPLLAWIGKRLPLSHQLFLIHGEVPSLLGLQARLAGILDSERIVLPAIDQAYELTPEGAQPLTAVALPRVEPDKVGHPDWHNDVSRLVLDIDAALAAAADDKARGVLVRRLRRALEDEAR